MHDAHTHIAGPFAYLPKAIFRDVMSIPTVVHIHLVLIHLLSIKAIERPSPFVHTSLALSKDQGLHDHAAFAFTMFTNSGFREAPPTKKPSTSGWMPERPFNSE